MRTFAVILGALLAAGCAAGRGAAMPMAAPLPPAVQGDEINGAVRDAVAAELASVVELYKWFHQNPELSLKEEKTAQKFAAEVRAAGWTVTEKVGGHGVVAVLRNGEGPVVLARIDMDGLPVSEKTGLPYASRNEGVMHACGHDSHLAMGIGLARVLAKLKDRWSGAVALVGQPAEEIGRGAKEMLEDPRFHAALPGRPVAVLSVHDFTEPAGTVGICPGYSSANVDSIDVTVKGRGGHGAWPHRTVDPIVIGAEIVTALQTIVSRKLPPGTRAVVTVGSFQAGTKHNIIPPEARLQLTVRSYEEDVRAKLLAEIRRIAVNVAEAHGAPETALVEEKDIYTPAVFHDPALSERVQAVCERLLGKDRVLRVDPVMGGEDVGRFFTHYKVPGLQIRVGGSRPGHNPEIGLHSDFWAIEPEPTLRTGTMAFARSVLDLLGKR
jgi:hippurate hydrolase